MTGPRPTAPAPPVRLAVVVPVLDGAAELAECLRALRSWVAPAADLLVVDDASTDGSAAVATAAGVRVLRLPRNVGAAAARNAGARETGGDVLVFIDADVVVAPDTVARLVRVLDERPDVAAVFGSYDAAPRAPGLVSQYRNLLHHFVHQHGRPEASTFWSGCGAIRRAVFEAAGGFDEGLPGAIEDIELGYRVRAAGHRIVLDRDIQATHLKRWTLRSVLWTDGALRALPWSRLVIARRPPADLNLETPQRVSVALTLVAAATLPLAFAWPSLLVLPLAAGAGVVAVNRRLLAFFARVRGVAFAAGTVPLLLLHYGESGLCYAWARVEHGLRRQPGAAT
jgi:GT2 family glycosyltransferase